MNTPESQSKSIASSNQRIGCWLIILAWLLMTFLCGLVILFGSMVAGGSSQIYTMMADGTAPKQITNSSFFSLSNENWNPAFSPDGTRIAYASKRTDSFDIYTMNPDGIGQIQLTNSPGNDIFPSWSPDGRRIAFGSLRDGNEEIYVMNADGTQPTRLTNNPAVDEQPTWSPDGTQIYFDSNRNQTYDIFMVNSDGTQLTQWSNSPSDEGAIAWSPDGAQVAFVALNNNVDEIFIYDVNKNKTRLLTNNSVQDSWPSWSPDGTRIAFAREGDIFVINVDGTDEKQLTRSPVIEWDPSWSPDGKKIVYVSNGNAANYSLSVLVSVLNCTLPILALGGFVFSLVLGLRLGPRKWPRFYEWIGDHAALSGIVHGSISGLLIAVSTLVLSISSQPVPEKGIILVLAGYVVLIFGAILTGPILGSAGGVLAWIIAKRFTDKTAILFVAAVFGGGIAGLFIGVLPNVLGWLTI